MERYRKNSHAQLFKSKDINSRYSKVGIEQGKNKKQLIFMPAVNMLSENNTNDGGKNSQSIGACDKTLLRSYSTRRQETSCAPESSIRKRLVSGKILRVVWGKSIELPAQESCSTEKKPPWYTTNVNLFCNKYCSHNHPGYHQKVIVMNGKFKSARNLALMNVVNKSIAISYLCKRKSKPKSVIHNMYNTAAP